MAAAEPMVIVDDLHIVYRVYGAGGDRGTAATALLRIMGRKTRGSIREVHAIRGMSFVAYRGLEDYRFVGAGWVLHTAWDVTHHLYGNPIIPFLPLSSFGCAICDLGLAAWYFAGAPSPYPWVRRADDALRAVKLSGSSVSGHTLASPHAVHHKKIMPS